MLTIKQIVNLEDIYKAALESRETALQSDWVKNPYAECEYDHASGIIHALDMFAFTEQMHFDQKGNLKKGREI